MEIRVSSQAEEDIEKNRSYLEAHSPGIEERFHADVMDCLRYIEQHPGAFQIRSKTYRYAPLSIFHFHIVYSIEGSNVVVHRVRHMNQRPLKRYFGS